MHCVWGIPYVLHKDKQGDFSHWKVVGKVKCEQIEFRLKLHKSEKLYD